MSKAREAFFNRVHRRAVAQSPELSRELLKAYEELGEQLSKRGANVDEILSDANLDRIFTPFRAKLHAQVGDAVAYFAKDLPRGK